MSAHLAMLGAYSNAMFAGDENAVFEHWSPDFVGGPRCQDGVGLTH